MGDSHQHGLQLGQEFLFKATSNGVDLNVASLQTGEKSWHKKVQTKNPTDCNVTRTSCHPSLLIFLEKQSKGCAVWHCWSHSTGVSAQLWRKKSMKWGAEQKAEIIQVMFEGWNITCHMLCSQSFTLIFCTIFHRMIFREGPVRLSYQKCDGGKKKNFHVVKKVSRRKKMLLFFFLCMYFNSNLLGLLYSTQHVRMLVYLKLLGLVS